MLTTSAKVIFINIADDCRGSWVLCVDNSIRRQSKLIGHADSISHGEILIGDRLILIVCVFLLIDRNFFLIGCGVVWISCRKVILVNDQGRSAMI